MRDEARPGVAGVIRFVVAAALSLGISFAATPDSAHQPWTLERLLARIAPHDEGTARFSETRYLSVLTAPLKSSGVLRFRRPDFLEKQVLRPTKELLRVEGNRVTLDDGGGGSPRTMDLDDYPQILAMIASIRAPLTGDVAMLNRLFQVSVGGSERRWLLALTPRDARVAELLRAVYIRGREDVITAIEIQQRNGDRSEMAIEVVR
ncbi:MAG: LolA-related protein [Methylotetracoccus sp.]